MQQNLLLQKNIVSIVVVVCLIGVGVFFFYSGNEGSSNSSTKVDKTLFSKEVLSFYNIKDTINFKDLSFMKESFYSKMRDDTVEIPSVKPTGRPNPFVPYVTP